MIAPLTEAARLHWQALSISSHLTETWRRMYRPMAINITPEMVLNVLFQAGIRPVLMGTHGLGGWRSEPRATQDVDLLVRKKEIKKAVRCLERAFPKLIVKDTPVVTRFEDPNIGKVVIDIMKPTQPIFRLVFRHTISAGETHDVPDLEMALVSKFAAMTSHHRAPEKKMIDGGDFMDVVIHNRSSIDIQKLRRLANKVYPGGETEILEMIADVDARRTLKM